MSNREEIQITDLEPSIEGGDDVEYVVQIRGIDATGRPGPWSEELTFTSPQQIPSLESVNYVPGESGWKFDNDGNAEINGATFRGLLESANYVEGVSGWRLTPEGFAEFGSGIFRGALKIGENTFNVDSNGNLFIGGSTFNNSPFAVDTNGQIAAMSISGNFIQANTITATQIAANTITAGQIAANTIRANEIRAGTITANEISDSTITGSKIVGGTITGANIADATISGAKIANATITGAKIGNAQITGAKIANATITDAQIGSLNADKITAGTISADRVFGGTLSGANIFNFGGLSIGSGATIDFNANRTRISSGNLEVNTSIFNSGMTFATGTDIVIDSNNRIGRVFSSIRYKENVRNAEKIPNLLNISPVYFDYKTQEDFDFDGSKNVFGAIAEELDDLNIKDLVNYSKEGPESINYKLIGLALIPYVKELYDRIEELERKLNGS